jgi:hypothetical protein
VFDGFSKLNLPLGFVFLVCFVVISDASLRLSEAEELFQGKILRWNAQGNLR